MKVFKDKNYWINERKSLTGKSTGFVPTMGALHEGHFSLIRKSIAENDITVVSIFVNPTQFDSKEDLKKYPDLLERDKSLLSKLGVDYLFNPDYDYIYPDDFKYRINETDLSKKLCGAHRPGHFTGVLTVVMKLFNIVKPDRAYFGEKDFQQFQLIKGMTEAFFMDVEIIPCPVVREKNGLAISSRNIRLNGNGKKLAPKLNEILNSNLTDADAVSELNRLGFKTDYVETINNRRFGAAYLNNVRLIDNVEK